MYLPSFIVTLLEKSESYYRLLRAKRLLRPKARASTLKEAFAPCSLESSVDLR